MRSALIRDEYLVLIITATLGARRAFSLFIDHLLLRAIVGNNAVEGIEGFVKRVTANN